MADPYTKSEVSSVSRCGDITWGVKFSNGFFDPDHAPFREDFSSAEGGGRAMVSQCTKYKVPRLTRYEAVNGGAKCKNGVVWGTQGQRQ